jgi:hypothetical protein
MYGARWPHGPHMSCWHIAHMVSSMIADTMSLSAAFRALTALTRLTPACTCKTPMSCACQTHTNTHIHKHINTHTQTVTHTHTHTHTHSPSRSPFPSSLSSVILALSPLLSFAHTCAHARAHICKHSNMYITGGSVSVPNRYVHVAEQQVLQYDKDHHAMMFDHT